MLLVAESKTSPFQKPQIAAEDELPTRPTDAALETVRQHWEGSAVARGLFAYKGGAN
jgi:hypothetical protein